MADGQGRLIAAYRGWYKLSQPALAEALADEGERVDAATKGPGKAGVRPSVGRDLVSRWERGACDVSPRYRRLLCAVFHANPAELGFRPPLPGERIVRPWDEAGSHAEPVLDEDQSGAEVAQVLRRDGRRNSDMPLSAALPPGAPRSSVPGDETNPPVTCADSEILADMNRRDILTAGTTMALTSAGGPLPWIAPSSVADTGFRVGSEQVDLLRSAAEDLDVLDQRFGGDRLWRSARAHLMSVHHLIDQGSYNDAVGQSLHGIAGQLTTSLGWFCYDADQQVDARVYYSEALNIATLAGDEALATRTLSNMSRQSVDLGKAREAVRLARIACSHATAWAAPPRVFSLLAIREAQGYAHLGDATSAENAIKKAWTEFDKGFHSRDPDWVEFLNEAELTCLEGMCRIDLGQYSRAVDLLALSARLQDIEHSRNRGMCLVRLAYAALNDRDLDHTVSAVSESLALVEAGMTSTRNIKQLGLVHGGLSRHHGYAPAREVAEKLSRYIA